MSQSSGANSGAGVRAEAARVIDAVVSAGRSLDKSLQEAEQNTRAQDRPLLRMLCYGTLRAHFRLREQIAKLLDRPLKARDSVIDALLEVGIFQLIDTRVPDHAAVSATVEAARLLRRPKYAGLVNAILRNFVRRDIAGQPPGSDESRFNHPDWMIGMIRRDWPDHWQQILEENNNRAPMWLRLNGRQTSVEQYLAGDAVDGCGLPGFEHAVRLAQPVAVDELPGFSAGMVSVQDAAAQVAAPWLLQNGGRRILDACAAPGGKTGHLLELMDAAASLTAIDRDPARLGGVSETLQRLGLHATVMAADASNPGEWHKGGRFDRILLDAPCSASGVIRRHPDIKLTRRRADIAKLSRLQGRILQALWAVLDAGGRLLYVTCSVFAEENERVISAFLAANTDASENRLLHNNNIRDVMIEKSCGFQILPGTAGMDGFYFAYLEKAA